MSSIPENTGDAERRKDALPYNGPRIVGEPETPDFADRMNIPDNPADPPAAVPEQHENRAASSDPAVSVSPTDPAASASTFTISSEGDFLRGVLLSILAVRGRDVFLNLDAFGAELRARGVGETDCFRLLLMSRVRGFPRLIDPRAGQYDLEHFLLHAQRETGFRRDVVLELTGAFAALSGLSFRETDLPWVDGASGTGSASGSWNRGASGSRDGSASNSRKDSAFDPAEDSADGTAYRLPVYPIPASLYEKELSACRKEFDSGGAVSPAMLSRMRALSAAGIPEARYLMGAYLLRQGQKEGGAPEDALRLLEAAARDGEPHASAALGDYYYARRSPGDWAEAYRRYTGYGAPALDDRRRIALVDILNQKIWNERLLRLGGWLLGALAFLVLLPAGPADTSVGLGWLLGFLLAGGAGTAAARYLFRREPYGEFYGLPVFLLTAWTVCRVLRCLL